MPFSYQVTNFNTCHGGGKFYIRYRYLFAGEKLNKTENERRKKSFVPSLLLAANECHGIMANVRWIISLTVQYNVRHLVLSLLVVPRPLHHS